MKRSGKRSGKRSKRKSLKRLTQLARITLEQFKTNQSIKGWLKQFSIPELVEFYKEVSKDKSDTALILRYYSEVLETIGDKMKQEFKLNDKEAWNKLVIEIPDLIRFYKILQYLEPENVIQAMQKLLSLGIRERVLNGIFENLPAYFEPKGRKNPAYSMENIVERLPALGKLSAFTRYVTNKAMNNKHEVMNNKHEVITAVQDRLIRKASNELERNPGNVQDVAKKIIQDVKIPANADIKVDAAIVLINPNNSNINEFKQEMDQTLETKQMDAAPKNEIQTVRQAAIKASVSSDATVRENAKIVLKYIPTIPTPPVAPPAPVQNQTRRLSKENLLTQIRKGIALKPVQNQLIRKASNELERNPRNVVSVAKKIIQDSTIPANAEVKIDAAITLMAPKSANVNEFKQELDQTIESKTINIAPPKEVQTIIQAARQASVSSDATKRENAQIVLKYIPTIPTPPPVAPRVAAPPVASPNDKHKSLSNTILDDIVKSKGSPQRKSVINQYTPEQINEKLKKKKDNTRASLNDLSDLPVDSRFIRGNYRNNESKSDNEWDDSPRNSPRHSPRNSISIDKAEFAKQRMEFSKDRRENELKLIQNAIRDVGGLQVWNASDKQTLIQKLANAYHEKLNLRTQTYYGKLVDQVNNYLDVQMEEEKTKQKEREYQEFLAGYAQYKQEFLKKHNNNSIAEFAKKDTLVNQLAKSKNRYDEILYKEVREHLNSQKQSEEREAEYRKNMQRFRMYDD
jgi:hypothetical protein